MKGGRVRIIDPNNKDKTLRYINKGDFFGERALILKEKRSADVITDSDTKLISICKNDLLRCADEFTISMLTRRIE